MLENAKTSGHDDGPVTPAEAARGSAAAPGDSGNSVFTLTLESAGATVGAAARVRQEVSGATDGSIAGLLLRRRLRAAAAFFSVVLTVLLVCLAVTSRGPHLLAQGAIVAFMATAYGVLSGGRALSRRTLRALEIVVFGGAALFLAARQHQAVATFAVGGDPSLVILSVKTTMVATVLLIFAYSMFVPNSGRSAAAVALLLALTPVATEGFLALTNPQALAAVSKATTPARVAEDVALLAIAAGLAVYGSHVIQSLRVEARAARELNQYRLVRQLGTGGMGEVYLAEHQLLKRPCAVKLIRHDSAADPIELTRFEREVRATARLSHPNTVEVYDYGRTDDGTFYYVMEYLRGLSLEEIARKHGPVPAARVIYLLKQVCGALAEAHDAGLVHRDVKPANVFACARAGRTDVVKLLDFGLVKGPALGLLGEPTDALREGMIRGTPLYMAPEQIVVDAEVDHRCDIYALGGVAYRLLTGGPPFDRDSRTEVLGAHAHEPVVPPRNVRAEVPEDLERVILRCLEKDPDERFQDARSLADALDACEAAADWDADRADLWWREHEPDAVAPLSPLL